MHAERASLIRHVMDSLVAAVLAALVVVWGWSLSQPYLEAVSRHFKIGHLVIAGIGGAGMLGWLMPAQAVAFLRAVQLWPRHWGTGIRTLIGSSLALMLSRQLCLWEGGNRLLVVAIGAIALIEVVVFTTAGVAAHISFYIQGQSNRTAPDREASDRPIETLKENEFQEYETAARRVLTQLEMGEAEAGGANVAVIGRYGSGKTSLCNLVRCLYEDTTAHKDNSSIIFCRFEAWQYLTPDGAVRGLLDRVVSAVQESIDCTGLAGLADEYVDAVGAAPSKWVGWIAGLLRRSRDPQEIIERLLDVLVRMRKRVIVFVDDFDRLERQSAEVQQAVAAALNQLQHLAKVQYVLCVGPQEEGGGSDLLKLTRFQELVPPMHGEEITKAVCRWRDKALRGVQTQCYFPYDLYNEGSQDPLTYYLHREAVLTTLMGQIVNLIQTPRELWALEREVGTKWRGGLEGELSWYDLLMISALKVSEPRIFEWILREPGLFSEEGLHFQELKEEEKQATKVGIERKLKRLLKVRTERRFDLVTEVVRSLFPEFMTGLSGFPDSLPRRQVVEWEQSIAFYRGFEQAPYFRKYVCGCVPREQVADQPTLQFIRHIMDAGFDRDQFEARYLTSYDKQTKDINTFVRFSGLLDWDMSQQVCECMLDWFCVREHWKIWPADEDYVKSMMVDVASIIENAGQFAFSQARRKAIRPASRRGNKESWAKEQLESLARRDLVVAYYFSLHAAAFLQEGEAIRICLEAFKDVFLGNKGDAWRQFSGKPYYLKAVIQMINVAEGYECIRDKVTEAVGEQADEDESGDFSDQVIIALAEETLRPDSTTYAFHVEKAKNQKAFNMEKLMPRIKGWMSRPCKDAVAAKALEALGKAYVEELRAIQDE
ncbi:MAG: AAA family ATPase [Phycisphaerae bacterium]|nr:AAA family ATPase [Phycisphaerae bacterium]